MSVCVRLDRWLVRRRMSMVELADRVGVAVADLQVLKAGRARAVRRLSARRSSLPMFEMTRPS